MSAVRILLLEDSALDAELAARALHRGGVPHETQRVQTRDDFVWALDQRSFDLILSDYVLPGFGGNEALELARAKCPEIPFIFVSGAIGEETAIESLKNGATDYVLKQRLERLPSAVSRATAEFAEKQRRIHAERALRQTEGRYRTLIESATDFAIFMLDEQGSITTWSTGAERMLGYTESEICSQSVNILFTPEDREQGAFETEMRVAREQGRAADERMHIRKDGTRFWASGVLAPVREDTALQGFVKVMRDVTDSRRAQEQLRFSNQELEQFAYAASHDMQEPLRTVNSYAQLLLRRYRGKLDADAEEFLGYIQGGVRHMQLLIADLLAYSHLLHEHNDRRRAVPLEDVLKQVILVSAGSIRDSGALITHDPLPVINGDESQITQVMQNLLSNSLKYQEEGNIPNVHLSAKRNGDEWMISVRDNGIGFEPEYADRIFGLFRRLHREQYPGTGIGLALSKRIIERHGGSIWAESQLGVGSTFYFTLRAI